MPEFGWTQAQLAHCLMASRPTVSHSLHEEKAVNAEMAIRISSALGFTPKSWLRTQQAIDLWDAGIKFKKIGRLRHSFDLSLLNLPAYFLPKPKRAAPST
ncbi:MAG: addiction module antidote protein, HigA family [Rhodoferax sp.]|nr:addiction module antidote protein, HigA family [Rhodoferax sp.]